MHLSEFQDLQRYVGFDAKALEALRQFHPRAEVRFHAIVDDFYAQISASPRASSTLKGGQAQVTRLKQTMLLWLRSLLLDARDESYLMQHSRIGRVHVRIGLPQEFMFGAVNRIRLGLTRAVAEQRDVEETRDAIHQALDLELAIMLESYRSDMLERVRAAERLSTIGQLSATVGHELRGPLGVIDSSNFLLKQHLAQAAALDDVVQKHTTRISEQVQASNRTIAALLSMTREAPPQRIQLPLLDVLEQITARLALKDLVLSRDFDDSLLVFADAVQLDQLLSNLLSNAVAFSPEGGSIHVRARRERGGTEIRIEDQGPGVPQEYRSQIFDVLFTTRSGGTGLGLALCRKIVTSHGGELELMSVVATTSNPQGACFRVWLPDAEESVATG